MKQPNIVFLHSHNTGRYIEPYGHAIPSPNLMRLARDGALFRQAFSTAPTCSPSRASFLTGMWPHVCGMYGLGHRGFSMPDYRPHLAQLLKNAGYTTVLSGVEHTAPNLDIIGYDRVISADDTNYPAGMAENSVNAAVKYLRSSPATPFFLSVGLNETHRPFPPADSARYSEEDSRYVAPVRPFPDTPETRAEAADLKAAVRVMDASYGEMLDAVDAGRLRKSTYIFCFTDHGLQFPRNMCNLTVHGAGVYLIVRGPEHFEPGSVIDSFVSLVDLHSTVCELTGLRRPSGTEDEGHRYPDRTSGKSLLPLVDGKTDELHEYLFSEINYHAAYEPTRAIRTPRYVLIRRFDDRNRLVLPNVDDTPSKDFLLSKGWRDEPREAVMLFDRFFDPDEVCNVADRPELENICRDLSVRLEEWMRETNDPLLSGPIPAPSGSRVNETEGKSPRDPADIQNSVKTGHFSNMSRKLNAPRERFL